MEKSSNVAVQENLVRTNLPFVVSVAKQYLGKGLELDDLVNEGNLGLVRAAGKYDESRGVAFVSYAAPYIRQAIQQAIAEQSRVVKVPATKVSEINRVNRLRAMFMQENERHPNVNEIAEVAQMHERNVKETLRASSRQVSVDAPFSDSNPSSLLDMLRGDDEPETDYQVTIENLRYELREAIAMLSEREQNVLRAFYGIDEPEQTFAEIGARYGMTRERARQIRKKAVRHLRSRSTNHLLRNYLG